MSAKVKLPPELANLLRSELETAIYEAALHRDDELIAKRRIIDKWAGNGHCGGAWMGAVHGIQAYPVHTE